LVDTALIPRLSFKQRLYLALTAAPSLARDIENVLVAFQVCAQIRIEPNCY
jgi:hypothetical protein